jgi:ubiquinone/menaquinone biosynthesis C-methylase UbiE
VYKKPYRPRNTSWNQAQVAEQYDRSVSTFGSDFHQNVIVPKLIPLLKLKKGERALDAGCGQGILCRKFAELGLDVVGIDSAPKLIDLARGYKPHYPRLNYRVMDAGKTPDLITESFDIVTCVLAIQNMDPVEPVISEMSRVLKKNGRLALVINHPCFRIPRHSGWYFDEKRKLQMRWVDSYMTAMKIPIQMRPGMAPDVYTLSFHRPLSTYIDLLTKNGLLISGLEEWTSHRESKPGRAKRSEDTSRIEFPLFMAIMALKA